MAASMALAVIGYFPSAFGGMMTSYTARRVTTQTGATIEAQITETGSYVRNRMDRAATHVENRSDEVTEAALATFRDVGAVGSRAISQAEAQINNVGNASVLALAHTTRGALRVTNTAHAELLRVGRTTNRELSRAGQSWRNETRRAGDEVVETANVARDEIRTTCKTFRVALLVLTTAGFAYLIYLISDKSCASDRFSIICNSSETAVISTIFLALAGLLSLYQLNFRQKDANGSDQMPQLQKLIGREDIAEIAVKQGGMIEISPCDRNDRLTVTQSDFFLRGKKVGVKYTIRSEKFQEDIRWLVRGPHSFRKL